MMQFTPTDEQEQIRSAARSFFDEEAVIERSRRWIDDGGGEGGELWTALGRQDYLATTVPTDYGGLGEDIHFAITLFEEAGRCALPCPFPETVAFAAPLIAEVGTEEQRDRWLPAIADGDLRMSLAVYDEVGWDLPGSIQLEAEAVDDGYRLAGRKRLVPYGGLVDRLVVPARTRDGRGGHGITLFVVDVESVTSTRRASLDGSRPYFEVTLDGLVVPADARLGAPDEGWSPLRRALDRYRIAGCAMLTGGAERAVELSAEHAKEREQFGHPIGRFQSVKHRIVDMWMEMEAGRSLVYYAAWALAADAEERWAVSAAKAFCGERYPALIGDDIQNHGAIGITWDHDAHIYLKQATAWKNFLGSPRRHRERIAEVRGY